MQKELKQAVCKTVALGPCWFKSNSADYMPQSLKWWRSCLLNSWSVIPACGFEPRLWRYTGVCANRAGSLSRKQVDPKGSEGSNPSILAFKPLWQNWQMHLPAKQGSARPASGVGTRERRSYN